MRAALQPHLKRYSDESVQDLVRRSRVKAVLHLGISHDGNFNLSIEARIRDLDSGETRTNAWSDISVSNTRPPSLSIEEHLDSIAEFVTGDVPKTKERTNYKVPSTIGLPDSIQKLANESRKSPLHAAIYLQVLGMLHPGAQLNDYRLDLFERSLVALSHVDKDSELWPLLAARAYAYLDQRPVAVEILKEAKTGYQRDLLDALNGNLRPLERKSVNYGSSLFDFMAWRDYLKLKRAYHFNVDEEAPLELGDNYKPWSPFIRTALAETNAWASTSIVEILSAVHSVSPSNNEPLSNRIAASLLLEGNVDEISISRQIMEMAADIRRLSPRESIVDASHYVPPNVADLANLAEMIVLVHHWRRVRDDLYVRVLPDRALQRLQQFDALFADHPELLMLKSAAIEQETE